MELYTGSIYNGHQYHNLYRVSVMSRHTDKFGQNPDPLITKDTFNEHIPLLGPRPRIVGAYYRDEITFEELQNDYRAKLREPEIRPLVEALAYWALYTPTILLCVEQYTSKHKLRCHRLELAAECKRIYPALKIRHLSRPY